MENMSLYYFSLIYVTFMLILYFCTNVIQICFINLLDYLTYWPGDLKFTVRGLKRQNMMVADNVCLTE